MFRSFWKALWAVLIGNAVYFLLLMPLLPAAGRHRPFHVDVGLVVDFWLCVVAYGTIEYIARRRERRQT